MTLTITTYFRHPFTVETPAGLKKVEVRLVRDDGAVVYLNGKEVQRSNMPVGDIKPDTLAKASINAEEEGKTVTFSIPARKLQAGTNTLAVEIHQAKPTSSDLAFDLALEVEL